MTSRLPSRRSRSTSRRKGPGSAPWWIATPPWFRSFVSHEQRATTLRNWFPGLLDGLVQTEDYARAILTVSPGVTEDEIPDLVAGHIAGKNDSWREYFLPSIKSHSAVTGSFIRNVIAGQSIDGP